MPVTVRAARRADAPALLEIYNWAVHNSTATMDTTDRAPEGQAEWLETHDGNPYPAIVAVDLGDGRVVGYASLSRYNPKPGYRTTAENSIYVHPERHGQGIGAILLEALLNEARERGFVSIVALITADNIASLRLHRRFGFTEIGTLRRVGRKFDRWIDVSFLQIFLNDAEATPDA